MCPHVLQQHSIVQSQISLDSNAMLLPGRVPGYKDSVRREAPSVQHHQMANLGALPPGSSNKLNEGSGITNLHSALASTTPQRGCDEANE